MDTSIDTTSFDIDIACSLSAAEQADRGGDWGNLLVDADGVSELPDGYALRFPNQAAWIARAAALIVAERECCPFFGFALVFEPNNGPIWLHISGPGEVKTFIRDRMVPLRLLHPA